MPIIEAGGGYNPGSTENTNLAGVGSNNPTPSSGGSSTPTANPPRELPFNIGNTYIEPDRPTVTPKPETAIIIQDEENPIPDKYEGDINFNKTVYSLKEFRDKIDLGFNELILNTPPVNIQQFFDLYNELFFDIPKEGENSHTTIVQTSLDYLDDYINPLQSIIEARDLEIQSLNNELLAIQTELTNFQINAEQEEIAEESQEANWLAVYGSTTDPIIKLSWLKINIETYRPQLDNDRDSYFDNIKDDLNKAGSAGGNAARPASQWKVDINNVGGSTGTKKADLRALVDATVLKISSNAYEVITNAWKL